MVSEYFRQAAQLQYHYPPPPIYSLSMFLSPLVLHNQMQCNHHKSKAVFVLDCSLSWKDYQCIMVVCLCTLFVYIVYFIYINCIEVWVRMHLPSKYMISNQVPSAIWVRHILVNQHDSFYIKSRNCLLSPSK